MDIYSVLPLGMILPELLLLVVGSAVLLLGQTRADDRGNTTTTTNLTPWVALLGVVAALLYVKLAPLAWSGLVSDGSIAGGGLLFDQLADFVRAATLVLGVLIVLVSWSQPFEGERGEYFAMVLFSLLGLMVMGSAADMIILFLGLELVSIPTYVLVTISRKRSRALEAGTKYFYLGAMAAAITAYGLSFLYGVSGTASLPDSIGPIVSALQHPGTLAHSLAVVGVVVTIIGLSFKIAAFPLHFYIADVYQGAASPIAGLLGFVPKLAGLVGIFKVLELAGWQTSISGLFAFLWIVAAVSMTVGNVLALRQTSIKRMLGYSGIAHSGYMVVGLLAGPYAGGGMMGDGVAAVLFYVVVYGIANLGAFAVLGALHKRGVSCESVRDVAGLIRRHPGPALLMVLSMFTLMGMPPTPGFWGKAGLFGSALNAARMMPDNLAWWTVLLVVIGVINSAIGAAYYLRVIASCILYESDEPAETSLRREAQQMGAILCGYLLLFFAIYPNWLLQMGQSASYPYRPLAGSVAPAADAMHDVDASEVALDESLAAAAIPAVVVEEDARTN